MSLQPLACYTMRLFHAQNGPKKSKQPQTQLKDTAAKFREKAFGKKTGKSERMRKKVKEETEEGLCRQW